VAGAAADIEHAAARRRREEVSEFGAQIGLGAGGQLARVIAGTDLKQQPFHPIAERSHSR